MRGELEEKLALFLRQRMGEETFTRFARRLGFSQSTLHRLIHKQQSATLEKIQQIIDRLKCSYRDIFDIKLPSSTVKEDSSKPESKPPTKSTKYPKKKRGKKPPRL